VRPLERNIKPSDKNTIEEINPRHSRLTAFGSNESCLTSERGQSLRNGKRAYYQGEGLAMEADLVHQPGVETKTGTKSRLGIIPSEARSQKKIDWKS